MLNCSFMAQSTQLRWHQSCLSVNLTTVLALCAQPFACNWQLPFLNQQKGWGVGGGGGGGMTTEIISWLISTKIMWPGFPRFAVKCDTRWAMEPSIRIDTDIMYNVNAAFGLKMVIHDKPFYQFHLNWINYTEIMTETNFKYQES